MRKRGASKKKSAGLLNPKIDKNALKGVLAEIEKEISCLNKAKKQMETKIRDLSKGVVNARITSHEIEKKLQKEMAEIVERETELKEKKKEIERKRDEVAEKLSKVQKIKYEIGSV